MKLIKDEKINVVLVWTRCDYVYDMDLDNNSTIKKWSQEWYDLKKQRIKEEIELIKNESDAVVVYIETEMLGLKMRDVLKNGWQRNFETIYEKEKQNAFVIYYYEWEIIFQYTEFVRSIQDSRFRSIDIMDIVCLDDKRFCDDRNIDGKNNRYDGLHYTRESAPILLPKIIERVRAAIEDMRNS